MDQITYKTEIGIFEFPKSDVFERLKQHKTKFSSLESDIILKYLSYMNCSHNNVVPSEYEYFILIAVELIEKGLGSVICKKCDESFLVSKLKPITVGHGRTPFEENAYRKKDRLRFRAIFGERWFRVAIDNIKNPFRKRNSNPPMFGGKGYGQVAAITSAEKTCRLNLYLQDVGSYLSVYSYNQNKFFMKNAG